MNKNGVVALVAMIATSAYSQNIGVSVNGESVQFSGVGPQRVDGRVMVPLRGVMEKLGAYVSYHASTKTVNATRGDVDLQLVLGQRRAILNGKEVMLDVPAMEYRGSTLVPLRFMGEALGADVRWNPATMIVQIFTESSNPPNSGGSGNNNNTTIEIDGFSVTAESTVRAGSVIEFTLRGTPGGEAVVQIPGVVKDHPLKETSSGIYTGSYTVPSVSKNPITVSKATAIARLTIGREERLIQSSTTFQIDNQPPTISATTPDNNARVNNFRPNITAVFEDQNGTGIDSNTVRVRFDGKDVTNDATITDNLIAFKPSRELIPGKHDVEIEVQDRAGNRTSKNWAFNVVDKANVVSSFKHNAPQAIQPGDEITFTLVGEPKAIVSLQLGELKTLPMEETSPGKYVASYVVRRADRLEGMVATAKVKTREGETYSSDLTIGSKVTSDQPLSTPKFTSHESGSSVGRTTIFKGKAEPNSKVQVHIEFTQRVFGAIPMNGTIADLEIESDSKGNWETKEIDLDTGLGRSNITYTITAIAVGANGKPSDAAKITLKR